MLVGQFLIVTAGEPWSVYAGAMILIVLIFWEAWIYFRIWKDFKFSITNVEFNKPFIVEPVEAAKIDVSVRNDGYMTMHDALIEMYVDGVKVNKADVTIERDAIRNVTFDWKATPGRHKFGVMILAREMRKRRKNEEMDMTGEFIVRKGKKIARDGDD